MTSQQLPGAELTPEATAFLQEGRTWVQSFLVDDEAREEYRTPTGKLDAVQEILDSGVLRAEHTEPLLSLGVVLGDALAQSLQLEWVTVDEVPALVTPGKNGHVLFPLTMISKRVENGEPVDARGLFFSILKHLEGGPEE
jgi:hypothetical protein